MSQDGKTYTFHLKKGATWSDGQAVKARDFEFSFKRLLDPATAADYASLFTDAGIVGAADFNSGKGSVDNVGVKATDDNTLQIQLQNPVGYFPDLVALPVVASNNKYNYCDQQFDQASQKGDTGTDHNQRMQAYAQAQQILVSDVPVAPLIFRGRMVLVKPWVQNLLITPKDEYPGISFLPQVSLTQH